MELFLQQLDNSSAEMNKGFSIGKVGLDDV